MRCKQCDYRLWNLTARRCPECGTPFLPSEFEFVPNSVQFCCPHCGQAYYGTDAKGHLVPPAFTCVRCGAAIQMDEMILLPATGLHEEQTRVSRMPWLDWRNRGLVRAWLATVGAALTTPGRLMRLLPADAPMWPARGFALLTLFVTATVAVGPFMIFPLVVSPLSGAVQILLGTVIALLIAFGLLSLTTLVWGLVTHGLLRLTGRTAGNSGRTMQAIYYSTGANILTAIPCLGVYLGWIWWMVSAVLMVREAQRVHGGRAALAVVLPPLLALSGLVGGYVYLFVAVLRAPSTAASPIFVARQVQTATVLHAVLDYAARHTGQGPLHASELVASGRLPAGHFALSKSATSTAAVPVSGTTLDALEALPYEEAQAVVAAAAAALPEGTVAHRVGDFVFVYHGADISAAAGGIWVVVAAPDALADPASQALFAGHADGSITRIDPGGLAAALTEQNALRAESGLPPLSDPTTVTHERPAVCLP